MAGSFNRRSSDIRTNGYTGNENLANSKRRMVIPIPLRDDRQQKNCLITRSFRQSEITRMAGTERLVAYYRPSPDGKRNIVWRRAFWEGDQPQLYSNIYRTFIDPLRFLSYRKKRKLIIAWSGYVGVHL